MVLKKIMQQEQVLVSEIENESARVLRESVSERESWSERDQLDCVRCELYSGKRAKGSERMRESERERRGKGILKKKNNKKSS